MTGEQLTKSWSKVKTWRDNGVEAKWGKTRGGAPIVLIKPSSCKNYYMLTASHLEIIAAELDRGKTLAEATAGTYAVADFFHV